jgi:hypothetical protein
MKIWAGAMLALLLTGCSADWHLRKALKKDPSLLTTKTITVMDTVVTEPIVVRDTTILRQRDTIEIVKDRFRLKIVRSFDTLMIDGGCDADTIYREIKVAVPQVVASTTKIQRVQSYTFWGLILFLLISVAYRIIRRSAGL